MPYKAPRLCGHQGCPNLIQVGEGYCPIHKVIHKTDYKRRDPIANRIYGSVRWKKFRKMYLARNPLCVNYDECGHSAATINHIKDHGGNEDLLWDESNMEPMCKHCHDVHTGETRGWGKKSEEPRPNGRYY